MKHSKTIRHPFLLITLILLCCTALFAGCTDNGASDKKTASEIAFAANEKPQDTYALGQELNLTKGKLTVTWEDGSKETIALNAEGVTVSGYDKNKLGQQSVVITFGGKSVNYSVNVIKRMTFTGHETEYFVGDSFNTDKGKVTILKDDGTRITAMLDDAVVSVVDFDSSVAGKGKQVTIRYSMNEVEYTDTIAVNVYEIGSVKLVKPPKYAYGNHETKLNLQGGYFTVTAKDNPQLSKHIPLEQEMVSGYDPSAVTKENIDTPVTQTITVSYMGETYSFDINIRYSGVSLMRDAAKLSEDIRFDNADQLEISEEQADAAMEALRVFVQMTPAERAALEQEKAEQVARVAAACSSAFYLRYAKPFEKALDTSYGGLTLNGDCSYDDVTVAVEYLSDPDSEFVRFCEFMWVFMEQFADVTLVNDKTIQQSIGYVAKEDIPYSLQVLQFLQRIHDDLAAVPEAWTAEDLRNYGEGIETAVRHIHNFEHPGIVTDLCTIASGWRAKNDYIEILYTYYYHHQPNLLVEELWGQLPLPGKLQTLYDYVAQAAKISQQVQSQGAQALWYDLINFHYYYSTCIKTAEEILNGEDELSKQLYAFVDFDSILRTYLVYSGVGYLNASNSLYGDAQYEELMRDFVSIYTQAMHQYGNVDLEANKDLLQSIFERFSAMTPARQRAFLCSLYYSYGYEIVNDSMLMDYSQGTPKGTFVFLMVAYFKNFIPESTHGLLQDLLLAMEYYMNNSMYETALTNFDAKMESLSAGYQALSQEDKEVFDQYLGNTYRKYLGLYEIRKNGVSVDEKLYEALFDEVVQTIQDFSILYTKLQNEETGELNEGMVGAMIAAFEHTRMLVDRILALNNDQVTALFYAMPVELREDTVVPLDTAFMNLRWNFILMMHRTSYTVTAGPNAPRNYYAWDFYGSKTLRDFLAEAFPVMKLQFEGSAEFDAAKMQTLMRLFREQMLNDPAAISAFYTFDADFLYYGGLRSFFAKVLTKGNLALAEKLLEAEKCFSDYRTAFAEEDKAACLTAFKAVMAEATALYHAATDTENVEAYLSEMYQFYLELASEAEADQ